MIIVAGIDRSGTTILWQIVKDISGEDPPKTHAYMAKRATKFYIYRDPRDIACSYARGPAIKRFKEEGEQEILLYSCRSILKDLDRQTVYRQYKKDKDSIMLKYEDFLPGDVSGLIDFVSEKLGIPVSEAKKKDILERRSLEANKKIAAKFGTFADRDINTRIHGNHITSNGESPWRDLMSDSVKKTIVEEFGDFILELGYSLD